jgi:hypothetical protein
MQEKLPPGEWLVIIAIIAIMFLLTGVSWLSDRHMIAFNSHSPHHLISQEIDVFVEGAVERSGAFKMQRGSTVQDVIALANPLPEANLNKLKMKSKLRHGQRIRVPIAASRKTMSPKGRKGK